MHRYSLSFLFAVLTSLGFPVFAQQVPDTTPAAVPARPTVTNPANIPPPGYLQFEQGTVEATDSLGQPAIDRQFSIVQTTKLALTPRIMIQAADQPFAHTSFASGPPSGDTGDLLLGAQVLLTDVDESASRKPTIAFGYNGRVRIGTSADLDIGSFSQGGLALISGGLFGFHYDTNFILNEQLGHNAAEAEVRRAQFGQSISLSRQLTKLLSLSGELWHFTQPLVTSSRSGKPVNRANAAGILFAVGYTLRPNLVFDAGFDHGLTSTSTSWESLVGFTYLLPQRLWPGSRL
jgi:hypothetical protein